MDLIRVGFKISDLGPVKTSRSSPDKIVFDKSKVTFQISLSTRLLGIR